MGEMSSTHLKDCIRYSNPQEQELSMCFQFHHLKVDYKNGEKWSLTEPDRMELKRLFEEWQTGMQRMLFSGATTISRALYPGLEMRDFIGRSQPRCLLPVFI